MCLLFHTIIMGTFIFTEKVGWCYKFSSKYNNIAFLFMSGKKNITMTSTKDTIANLILVFIKVNHRLIILLVF
jgi:hypothetical protein